MDVFISYRRNTGGVYADLFAEFFTQHGISFFWDVKSLHDQTGEFPEILRDNILAAQDFLLILSPGVFDGLGEDAIFVREINLALREHKNMIPVLCGGFSFPQQLPASLSVLPRLEGVQAHDKKFDRTELLLDVLSKMTKTGARQRALAALMRGTPLESRQTVEKREPLTARLSGKIRSIDICVLAGQAILSANREYLESALAGGARCRVVMLDPDSPAAKEAAQYKISGGSPRTRSRIIPNAYYDMLDWRQEWEGFDCRVTDWYLPCAIFCVETEDVSRSTIKVDYYSFGCPDSERRCVFIHPDDVDNYQFYRNQFEYIWAHARPVEEEGEQI